MNIPAYKLILSISKFCTNQQHQSTEGNSTEGNWYHYT